MDAICAFCGHPIPAARLSALPGVDTCVGCSDVRPRTIRDVPIAMADAGDPACSTAHGNAEAAQIAASF